MDDDFFLLLLTVHVDQDIGLPFMDPRPPGGYQLNCPVVQYFVFPEMGVSVALRPGDQLLFNPQYYHCLSERNRATIFNSVLITSMYLKTAVVGKNNSSIELTENETALLQMFK